MSDKEAILALLKDFNLRYADSLAESADKNSERPMLAMIRFLRPFQKTLNTYLKTPKSYVNDCVNRGRDIEEKCVKEMVEKGVDIETIGRYAYEITRATLNEVLYRLDDPAGSDYDLPGEGERLPSWVLKERDSSKEETNRIMWGMHSMFPFSLPDDETAK